MSRKIEHKIICETECKRCPACEEWLPLESFGKDNTKWDKLASRCKPCVSIYLKEYSIQYNIENKEKLKEYRKEYKNANREEINRKGRKYHQTPQGKATSKASKANRTAREKNAGILTPGMIKEVYDKNIKLFGELTCVYCEKNCENDWHLEHKTPLCRDGLNEKENLTISCPTCNLKKARKTEEEFNRL